MTVQGMLNNGGKVTLYVTCEFEEYHKKDGRKVVGKMTKNIYIGDYPLPQNLKIGSEIEIYYGEAVSSKNGVFSPVKLIQVMNNKQGD